MPSTTLRPAGQTTARSTSQAPQAGRGEKRGPWPAWLGAGVVAAIGANYVARMTPAALPDDAYYYLVIARNIAAGAGSTFDRLEPTNGYQPLWMCVLVPLLRLWGVSPEPDTGVLRVVAAVCFALTAGTVWLTVRIALAAGLHVSVCALLAAALAVGLTFDHRPGMETQLVQLLGLTCVWVLFVRERRPPWLLSGLLLGAFLLSRLDNVLLVFTVGLCCLVAFVATASGRRNLRRACVYHAAVLAVAVAIFGGYLLLNQMSFGDALPISSRLKVRQSAVWPASLRTWSNHYYGVFYWVAGTGVAAACAWLLRGLLAGRLAGAPPARSLGIVACGALLAETLHIGYQQLYGLWGLQFSWHYPMGTLVLAFCGMWAATQARAAAWGLLCLVPLCWVAVKTVLLAPQDTLDPRPTDNWVLRQIDAGRWAHENLPAESRAAMSDCGAFAYFFGGRVLNLDGLTAGPGFHHAIGRGRLAEYLSAARIGYLGHHVYRNADSNGGMHINFAWRFSRDPRMSVNSGRYEFMHFFFYSRLYPHLAWHAPLPAEQQVFRSETFDGGTARVHLWRIEHPLVLEPVEVRERPADQPPPRGPLGRDR